MASWREISLACATLWLPAGCMSAGASLPADGAENAAVSVLRSGQVQPGAGGVVALAAMEAAVRADAALLWPLADPKLMQIAVEELNWADGSLGCPRAGMAYTQALVPGWRLIVRSAGFDLTYHASRRGHWLLCPLSGPRPPSGPVTR